MPRGVPLNCRVQLKPRNSIRDRSVTSLASAEPSQQFPKKMDLSKLLQSGNLERLAQRQVRPGRARTTMPWQRPTAEALAGFAANS
jgi:hypothetical protein